MEQTNWAYTSYPPSILLVADSVRHAGKLKQKLVGHGCQVYQADISSDEVAKARQKYFELIVFDIKRLDANSREVCRRIKTDPELADIPMVILTAFNLTHEAFKLLNVGTPASYLVRDNSTEEKLTRIIEQTHYMTYRYM